MEDGLTVGDGGLGWSVGLEGRATQPNPSTGTAITGTCARLDVVNMLHATSLVRTLVTVASEVQGESSRIAT